MRGRSRFLRLLVLVLGAVLMAKGGSSGVPPMLAARIGQIYVAENSPNVRDVIVRVNDMTGAGWTTLGTEGSGLNQFGNPHAIFVDGAGRIYVADTDNDRIVRVNDMTGAGWTTLGTAGTEAGQFDGPVSIFVDGAGRIYVADYGNSRVVRMNDMTGAGWTTLPVPGGPLGIFVH